MSKLNRVILEQVLEASKDGILIADAAGEGWPIVYANAAVEELTGYAGAELRGRGLMSLRIDERDRESMREFRDALADARTHEAVVRSIRRDGSQFWNRISMLPARDAAGEISFYIALCRDIGPQMGEARDNQADSGASAERQLEALVRDDKLTGVYNRRYFEQMLRRDWGLAQRENRPVSVFMFDIDYLSLYNQTFGYKAGDSCLRMVARTIAASLRRSSDLLARYGGEEFIAVVVGLDEIKARDLAEAIRKRVKSLCIHHPKSEVAKYVTVSTGVASTVPQLDTPVQGSIEKAQQALEDAKGTGRDRVVCLSVD